MSKVAEINKAKVTSPISLRISEELLNKIDNKARLLNIDRTKFILKCLIEYVESDNSATYKWLKERIGILRIAILYGEHDPENTNFIRKEGERLWQLLDGLNTKIPPQND
jgi:metal-responsive CopG/Arc/MetJ family transcriptional regulator